MPLPGQVIQPALIFPSIPQTCCCNRAGGRLGFLFWQDKHSQQVIAWARPRGQRYRTSLKALPVFRELAGSIPVTVSGWFYVKFVGYSNNNNNKKNIYIGLILAAH